MLSRLFSLLSVFTLVVWSESCGGSPEEEPLLWPERVHDLSPTPGCFVDPPPVPVPKGASDVFVLQQQRYARQRDDQGVFCIDRFREILEVMSADPTAPQWFVRRPIEHGELIAKITSDGDRAMPVGRFHINLTLVPKAGEDTKMDPCFQTLDHQFEIDGSYSPARTLLSSDFYKIAWDESGVVIIRRTALGPSNVIQRGCDAKHQISYGHLVDYDEANKVSCWTRSGEFVSCDSIQTWPFAE